MAGRIVQQVEALRRTDEERRELIANISHDLRTPLAALRGYVETLLLKERSLTPEERTRFLEIAASQSEKLGTLVTELFELSRLEAHEASPQLERCSIAELVQDVVQRFQLQAAEKGVHVTAHFPLDLPEPELDIRLLERALQNLIENAIRFTPAGGAVTVSVSRAPSGALRVEVADTGVGIPEEELAFVFQRFYRARATGEADGTGLGLAIAKRIVELHGGELTVASRPGKGTRFAFELPAP